MNNELQVDQIYHDKLTRIADAAKQISTIVPILQTGYLAVISISDLRHAIAGQLWLWVIFLPVVFWLISLACTIQVFVPGKQREEETKEDARSRDIVEKYQYLIYAQYALLFGLVAMAVSVFVFFIFVPPPDQPKLPAVLSVGTPTFTPTATLTPMPSLVPTVTSTLAPSLSATPTP